MGMTVGELEKTVARRFRQSGERPNVSVALEQLAGEQQIKGEHLVLIDGTVTLGKYGRVRLAGMTRDEATAALERHLADHFTSVELAVDVLAYNRMFCYVVAQGVGPGNGVSRLPVTGKETVLDAISQIKGLDHLSSSRIWIARPTAQPTEMQILPVDWEEITRNPSAKTNYWLLPGDRIYVASEEPMMMNCVAWARLMWGSLSRTKNPSRR